MRNGVLRNVFIFISTLFLFFFNTWGVDCIYVLIYDIIALKKLVGICCNFWMDYFNGLTINYALQAHFKNHWQIKYAAQFCETLKEIFTVIWNVIDKAFTC